MGRTLSKYLGGMAETVLERRASTWSTTENVNNLTRSSGAEPAASRSARPAGDEEAEGEGVAEEGRGLAEWFTETKLGYWTAGSAAEAEAVAREHDFTPDATLLACAPSASSDGRIPALELASGAADCAQCYCAKLFGGGAGGEPGEGLSVLYTVESAREILPGSLGLVLLWVAVDEGDGRRAFLTESSVVVKGEGQGWRRCHSSIQAVRRHQISRSKL